ncbi:ComEC/Rec2 family competence protein [Sulfitobacter mediterraneus]|uniref:Competence protein ComEC n=1 Tax=Sulfitobacter mediterraneus TaxID=83219 RepID=A0A2T6CHW8_9RHOB|nr:competence protein ComEC [Sulfitobacter mediterraneus]
MAGAAGVYHLLTIRAVDFPSVYPVRGTGASMGRAAALSIWVKSVLSRMMLAQRGMMLGWVPVCLAIGIGGYFSLRFEPALVFYPVLLLGVVGLAVSAAFLSEALAPLAIAAALIVVGFSVAGLRAHSLSNPVLGWRYYGAVEGRIVAMDRSQSDALRLTLDQVQLERVPPARTPARVRISLHSKTQGITPEPGLRVMTTAHLSPPSGPVEPDGFDFQRHAWFAQLGAVGYTRVPLMGTAWPERGQLDLLLFRMGMTISAHIRNILPGEVGGFAAALTTGDRSAIPRSTLEDLRASNLAHLLAISGLHMGLLAAVVLGALRVLLSAIPYTALHWPTKKIAAICALVAAAGYLALSGGNVATERAFIMVGTALGALLIGRRAISLRAVAVAATIVLLLRPEALTGPGFQMSFAATVALVVVFGWLRDAPLPQMPRWGRAVLATVLSSAVAGFATAPIAAAHFNTIAHYGLVANLLSVPLMGVLVIPAAVLALVLSPFGLEALGLWPMGWGLSWILWVAHQVAGLEGARGYVMAPGQLVLPVLALGFLMLVLWQGRLRWGGALMMAAAVALWQGADRPDVLIAEQGTLVGVMGPNARALSKAKGAGFVAQIWLENDGDGSQQDEAAARWQKGPVVHLSGKRALAKFNGCSAQQIIVASVDASEIADAECLIFDPATLRKTGALALRKGAQDWHITTARSRAGDRLWTNWPKAERNP